MIICSCKMIRDTDIHKAIDWMRASDSAAIITPGKIYHALGHAPECGGCMKLFLSTMRKNANLEVPAELRALRARNSKTPTKESAHEGRHQSHRILEQSTSY